MSDTLVENEIFLSRQGESTFAGLPCVFVRLTGCPLRCSFCDTAYAFREGEHRTLADILARVAKLAGPFSKNLEAARLPLVELTGGEPLAQRAALPLMKALCDEGYTVLLETSGALDIGKVDARVRRIMDLKCPGSGEAEKNRWGNLGHLRGTDEIKFVLSSREDYEWAKVQIRRRHLDKLCPLLFSLVTPLTPEQKDKTLKQPAGNQTPISRQELAEAIIADALPVRFQVHLHKLIWPPEQRGV